MKAYFLIFTLILMSSTVFAATQLEVTVSPDNQEVVMGDKVNFVATLYNNKNENLEVTIK